MVLLIDNYDSFSYNLVHCVETLGFPAKVVRNDAMSAVDMFSLSPDAVILSPGPGNPSEAGVCVEFVKKYAGEVPIFGVCLGMQSIGYAFGADIVRAKSVMHGKISQISHDGRGVFRGMPSPMQVVRYHSLAVDEAGLPDEVEVSARAEDGEVMAIRHKKFLLEGVQFHPESIMTMGGKRLIGNFLKEAVCAEK